MQCKLNCNVKKARVLLADTCDFRRGKQKVITLGRPLSLYALTSTTVIDGGTTY